MHHLRFSPLPYRSRRRFLRMNATGLAYLALLGMLERLRPATTRAAGPDGGKVLVSRHHPARAQRVIFLCMKGGPSHVDLLDYKPELNRRSGDTAVIGSDGAKARLLGSPFRFQQHGQAGLWMSELLPHLGKQADRLCLIQSMHTDLPNHSQAFLQMHTGSFQFVRPSLGAWTLYGLGTENENLPGFITLSPPSDLGGARNYGNAFLPASCQGTKLGNQQLPAFYAALFGKDTDATPPFQHIDNPKWSRQQQRRQLDLIRDMDLAYLAREEHHPEVAGAVEAFELAFRMQSEVPQLFDLQEETAATFRLYGIGEGLPTDRFGRQCLIARRMAEAGVRFIEVTAPTNWDHHFMIKEELPKSCLATDQPVAALLQDLQQRGLLEDTLVLWAGEFGRTPYGQSITGRDHNHKGYTLWMAGGGVRGGMSYGATDPLGYEAVEQPVHLHDWHATILYLLGIDHQRLTFPYGGREFRLTDVHGEVVKDILA
jgi:hypothetical protein